MSLRKYLQSSLNKRLDLQDREEQLIRNRAQLDTANQKSLFDLLGRIGSGALQAGQMYSDYQDKELEDATKIASLLGEGTRKVDSIDKGAPASIQSTLAPLLPKEDEPVQQEIPEPLPVEAPDSFQSDMQELGINKKLKELFLPVTKETVSKMKEELFPTEKALTDITAPGTEIKEEAPPTPVVAGMTNSPAPAGATSSKSRLSAWEPPAWELSPREEAERQIQEALASKQPNPIHRLFGGGAKFEQAKALALKVGEKAIKDARSAATKSSLDQWATLQKIESERIRAEKEKNPELLAAEIELKKAQADRAKALADKSSGVNVTMTGDAIKDLKQGTMALNSLQESSKLFKELVGPKGSGLPSTLQQEKLKQSIMAASADVDASNASSGILASFSKSTGGKYIDDKVIDKTFDEINKLNLKPDQREFLRESLLLVQQIGKQREGGKLTDADLKFYLDTVLSTESPEMLSRALQRRSEESRLMYDKTYGSYVGENERWAKVFDPASSFVFNFDLSDPTSFGYSSLAEFEKRKAEWAKQDTKRDTAVRGQLEGARKEAGNVGFKRKTTPVGVAEQAGEEGLSVINELLKKEEPKGPTAKKPKGAK